MKKFKLNKLFCFIILIILFFLIIYFCFYKCIYKKNAMMKNENEINNNWEIEPEEELPEKENYNTKIKLFLIDPSSGILTSEDFSVDSRELLDNPYKYVINLLIFPPKETNLESAISKSTKINNCVLSKGTLIVDFNENFLDSIGTNAIYSVVNTMTQFNEVEGVIFKINGKENEQLKEKFVKVN